MARTITKYYAVCGCSPAQCLTSYLSQQPYVVRPSRLPRHCQKITFSDLFLTEHGCSICKIGDSNFLRYPEDNTHIKANFPAVVSAYSQRAKTASQKTARAAATATARSEDPTEEQPAAQHPKRLRRAEQQQEHGLLQDDRHEHSNQQPTSDEQHQQSVFKEKQPEAQDNAHQPYSFGKLQEYHNDLELLTNSKSSALQLSEHLFGLVAGRAHKLVACCHTLLCISPQGQRNKLLPQLKSFNWRDLQEDPVCYLDVPPAFTVPDIMLHLQHMPANLVAIPASGVETSEDVCRKFCASNVTVDARAQTLDGDWVYIKDDNSELVAIPISGFARYAALQRAMMLQLQTMFEEDGGAVVGYEEFVEAVLACSPVMVADDSGKKMKHTVLYAAEIEDDPAQPETWDVVFDHPSQSRHMRTSTRYATGGSLPVRSELPLQPGRQHDVHCVLPPMEEGHLHPAREVEQWSLFDSLSQHARCMTGKRTIAMRLGLNWATWILSMALTVTALHVEDLLLQSVNSLHAGAPKVWWWLPRDKVAAFEAYMGVKLDVDGCIPVSTKLYTKAVGKASELTPRKLREWGFKRFVQRAGVIVVTAPGKAFHITRSMGCNVATSGNFLSVDESGFMQWKQLVQQCHKVHANAYEDYDTIYNQILTS